MRFGRYLLHERIAVGGMAELFRATLVGNAGFERPVAIKCLLPHLAEDAELVRMFTDEAKIAVQLTHPNVAQILDLGHANGRYYIAQEFVEGRDLRTIQDREASRGATMPLPLAVEVATRTAEALHHAHQATSPDGQPMGIIHRDVSPQNILVSFEGEVKVVDFGLAKAAIRANETQAGVVKGKLAYMSPEQSRGQPIDRRSDVFALGICLWEMLAGEPLFLRRSEVETVLAVQEMDIPSLRAKDPRIPEELDRIVRRALQPDPARRFATALELHDELDAFRLGTGARASRNEITRYMHELFGDELAHGRTSGRGDAGSDDGHSTRREHPCAPAPADEEDIGRAPTRVASPGSKPR